MMMTIQVLKTANVKEVNPFLLLELERLPKLPVSVSQTVVQAKAVPGQPAEWLL